MIVSEKSNAHRTPIIFAPVTPAGQSGVAVYRLSGADLSSVWPHLGLSGAPKARMASLQTLCQGLGGTPIDQALILYFPAPHSFTGEDVAELHTHGSGAVRGALLDWLGKLEHCRLAQAGEFSKRAFMNGKMDLLQAEGIADLIAAETSLQQQLALRQMDGALSEHYEALRGDMLRALALLEAYLDFPDEEIPPHVLTETQTLIEKLQRDISALLHEPPSGEIIREGFTIAIVGAPNAGKSSLLNRLAGRDVAIVSDIAGTTRDRIEVQLNLNGYLVRLIDTAGLREASDAIEAEGIRRAHDAAASAHLTLWIHDIISPTEQSFDSFNFSPENTLLILNKSDLMDEKERLSACQPLPSPLCDLPSLTLSAINNDGIDALIERISQEISRRIGNHASPLLTRQRHREALSDALACLNHISSDLPLELYAEELRLAARAIGKITGHIEVDQLLELIFKEFCIGK